VLSEGIDMSLALRSVLLCGLIAAFASFSPFASAQAPPKDDERLICIGALAGAHVYTTYGYIGGVADAYAHSVYSAEKVQELMKEVSGLADVSIKQLKKVREGNIVENDKQVIDEVVACYELLQREAQALSAYTRSKDPADLKDFEKARTDVWPKIKGVLGIKDPVPGEAPVAPPATN